MDRIDASNTPLPIGRTGIGRLWLLVTAAVVLMMAIDIAIDVRGELALGHVLVEVIVAAGLVLFALWAQRQQHAHVHALEGELATARAESERWRADLRLALAGLGACIADRFDRWELTPAERETALLMLKGLSHKEIARARDIAEATVRQQAVAVYRKAGVPGRRELAALFLEELALPGD